jgi:nicotinamide-nucleotide amidase
MATLPDDLTSLASAVIKLAVARGYKIATAESCTGGLISSCLTAVSGSSDTFTCGFVTYSNDAKTRLLGVPVDAISDFGAVSDIVAAAMAEGAVAHSGADMAVAVTGIAGPDGGTPDKPVGLIYLSLAQVGEDAVVKRYVFAGNRDDVRRSTVGAALELMLSCLECRDLEDVDQEKDEKKSQVS